MSFEWLPCLSEGGECSPGSGVSRLLCGCTGFAVHNSQPQGVPFTGTRSKTTVPPSVDRRHRQYIMDRRSCVPKNLFTKKVLAHKLKFASFKPLLESSKAVRSRGSPLFFFFCCPTYPSKGPWDFFFPCYPLASCSQKVKSLKNERQKGNG